MALRTASSTPWRFPAKGANPPWETEILETDADFNLAAVSSTVSVDTLGPRDLKFRTMIPYKQTGTMSGKAELRSRCTQNAGGYYLMDENLSFKFDFPFTNIVVGMPVTLEIGWTMHRKTPLKGVHVIDVDVSRVLSSAALQWTSQSLSQDGLVWTLWTRLVGLVGKAPLGRVYLTINWGEEYYPEKSDPVQIEHMANVGWAVEAMRLTPMAAVDEGASDEVGPNPPL